MKTAIPIIDLSAFVHGSHSERKKIAAHVDQICRSTGFLFVDNHLVSTAIIDKAWSEAQAFFDLPLDQKMEICPDDPTSPRGYFSLQSETLSKSRGVDAPPDRKETFSSGALCAPTACKETADFDFFHGANLWPAQPPDFAAAWIEYYEAMERLGAMIMQLFAAALDLPTDYFHRFHTRHISALRANHYPASTDKLLPNQNRAGAHSEYGSVTILKPDPLVGGLEIQLRSGQWFSAPLVNDAFIINIGDMLARWTNDRWISTMHRVVEPQGDQRRNRRMSIAYFQVPNFDTSIKCIPTCLADGERQKYPPVDAGLYLIDRFRSTV